MIEKIITYQFQGDSRRFISLGMNLEASNPAQKPFWYSVRPNFFYVLARLPKRPKTEILYHQKPLNARLAI